VRIDVLQEVVTQGVIDGESPPAEGLCTLDRIGRAFISKISEHLEGD